MGGVQVDNCQPSAVSIMENLCPDIHTQLEGLLCGLPWKAAKLDVVWLLESSYPPLGPEFLPRAVLVYGLFLMQQIASTPKCSLFRPGEGDCSGNSSPQPVLAIGIPPCPPASNPH